MVARSNKVAPGWQSLLHQAAQCPPQRRSARIKPASSKLQVPPHLHEVAQLQEGGAAPQPRLDVQIVVLLSPELHLCSRSWVHSRDAAISSQCETKACAAPKVQDCISITRGWVQAGVVLVRDCEHASGQQFPADRQTKDDALQE